MKGCGEAKSIVVSWHLCKSLPGHRGRSEPARRISDQNILGGWQCDTQRHGRNLSPGTWTNSYSAGNKSKTKVVIENKSRWQALAQGSGPHRLFCVWKISSTHLRLILTSIRLAHRAIWWAVCQQDRHAAVQPDRDRGRDEGISTAEAKPHWASPMRHHSSWQLLSIGKGRIKTRFPQERTPLLPFPEPAFCTALQRSPSFR